MQDASRVTVTLDCRESQDDLIVLEDGNVKAQCSVVPWYQARIADSGGQADLNALTLFDWLQHWGWTTFKIAQSHQLLPQVFQ